MCYSLKTSVAKVRICLLRRESHYCLCSLISDRRKKLGNQDQFALVKDNKTGVVKKKKVVTVGSSSILDLLGYNILKAPENYLLNKVRPFDAWISKAEEAEERMMAGKKLSRTLTRGKSSFSQKIEFKPKNSLIVSNLEFSDGEDENSDYSEERKEKIKNILTRLPAVAKFFENRFDPMKFKVDITSQQMKSLILETSNFKASIGDEDIKLALTESRERVDLGEPFLSKFFSEKIN